MYLGIWHHPEIKLENRIINKKSTSIKHKIDNRKFQANTARALSLEHNTQKLNRV